MSKLKIIAFITLLLLTAGCSITEYSYTTEPNTSEINTSTYGGNYPAEIMEVSHGATGSYSESGYSKEYRW